MASRGLSPADLDPVEAASSPITPDPRVGRHVRGTMDASRDNDEAHSVLIAQLVEEGYSPREAAQIAARDMARAHIDSYQSPQPTPSAPPPAPEPKLTPDELRALGWNPFREPGPNMPDGTRARGPEPITTERGAQIYNTRPQLVSPTDPTEPGGTARYAPSMRDRDMAARGFRPVTNADGGVSWQLGPMNPQDETLYSGTPGLPGGLGRAGNRADMEAPMLDELGRPVERDGKAVPKFVQDEAQSPIGPQLVYRPSDLARERNDAYSMERKLYRDAEVQGVSPAQLYAENPEAYGDLAMGGIRSGFGVRAKNEGARQAQRQKQEEAWRAQMMLGGGRPTGGIGGSKATANAWLNLPADQRASAMRYMLPGGQLSATVDANNAAQAGRMAQAAMTAFLNNNPQGAPLNPLQQNQLDDKKAQQRQEAVQWAEGHVSSNYAEPQGIGNWLNRGAAAIGLPVHDNTEFTVAEQDKAIAALMARYPNLTLAEATQIIDSVGATRTTRPRAAPAARAPAGAAPAGMPAPPARGGM
jgi:hypothetical protein